MPAAKQQVNEDFLTVLRNATSQQHTQLESTDLSKKLLSDFVTTGDYKNYLLKMKDIIAYCEEAIFLLVENVITDINSRRKLALIQHDLACLQADVNASNLFQPIKKDITTPYALGFMYVVEGSTLGGRIILKHLKAKLGISEEECGTFFAGYKASTGIRWKDFLHALTLYTSQNNDANEIIEGAKDAFQSIYNYFSNTDNEN